MFRERSVMVVAMYFISILWIVLGTLLILHTDRTRGFLEKLLFNRDVRIPAVLVFFLGLLLLLGAFYYREMFWFAFVLGILAVAKGIYLFFGPLHRIKALMRWWFRNAADDTVRLFGLISFFLGTTLFSYLR